MEAKLIELPLTQKQEQSVFANVVEATPVLHALTECLNISNRPLLAADWDTLQKSQDKYDESPRSEAHQKRADVRVTATEIEEEAANLDKPVANVESIIRPPENIRLEITQPEKQGEGANTCSGVGDMSGDAELQREEPKQDATLTQAWADAKEGKGGMAEVEGLLYHKDKVFRQPVKATCIASQHCVAPMSSTAPMNRTAEDISSAIKQNKQLSSISLAR